MLQRLRLPKFVVGAPFLFIVLVHSALPADAQKSTGSVNLARRVESILRRPEARRGHWGIELVRLSDGKVLYSRNAEQLFTPASSLKLFTTAAALEKLGPDFRFRTTVEAGPGPDPAGRVHDLLLVGRGDSNLGHRVLPGRPRPSNTDPPDAAIQELADQVLASGVTEVTGNLVADDTYFLFEPFGRGWEEEDLQWGYGAPITALAFNDNALLIRFAPGASVGDTGSVILEPFADYYELNNRLRTARAGTGTRIHVKRETGSNRLDVWGEVAVNAGEGEDSVSIDNPARLATQLLRVALEARGVIVRGEAEIRHKTPFDAETMPEAYTASAGRVVLAEHISLPLSEDITTINKFSHNLHAEILVRTLGKELKGEGGLTSGLQVLEEFAQQIGIEHDEAIFADGSGLSRHSLVTPRAFIKLLKYMAGSAHFDIFLGSLPQAAEDGTLDKRFTGSPARGRVHAKTGTLDHVNALSGYMDLPSGERLAFSIMGNEHPMEASEGTAIVDRIVLTIYQQLAGRRGRRRGL